MRDFTVQIPKGVSYVSICDDTLPLPSSYPTQQMASHTNHTSSNVDPERHYSCKYPKGCPMSAYVMMPYLSPHPTQVNEATPHHPYLLWCWPWETIQLQVPKGLSYVSIRDDAVSLPSPHPSKLKALHTIHTCSNVDPERQYSCKYPKGCPMSAYVMMPCPSPHPAQANETTPHHPYLQQCWPCCPLSAYVMMPRLSPCPTQANSSHSISSRYSWQCYTCKCPKSSPLSAYVMVSLPSPHHTQANSSRSISSILVAMLHLQVPNGYVVLCQHM